jgi:hypothetical protein
VSRSLPGAGPVRRCLGPELSAYADRAMCPSELRQWDRHLVACMACRQAVDAERRLLAAMRGSAGPALPGDLRAMLLSLGAAAEAGPAAGDLAADLDSATGAPSGTSPHAPRRPPVRPSAAMPLRIPPPPVPVIDRTAPAMHRSAVRATVFAGLAAGASAAAAWSFAVVGTPLVPAAPTAPAPGTAVQRARPSTPSFTSASFGVPARARTALPVSATTVVFSRAGRPVVSGYRLGSAESAP